VDTTRGKRYARHSEAFEESSDMADKMSIQINVDTVIDGDAFFVRTEIDAHAVNVQGPFPDLQSAQRLKAEQLAAREKVTETLEEHLRHALSTWKQHRS
jgi:hypothetical protein